MSIRRHSHNAQSKGLAARIILLCVAVPAKRTNFGATMQLHLSPFVHSSLRVHPHVLRLSFSHALLLPSAARRVISLPGPFEVFSLSVLCAFPSLERCSTWPGIKNVSKRKSSLMKIFASNYAPQMVIFCLIGKRMHHFVTLATQNVSV